MPRTSTTLLTCVLLLCACETKPQRTAADLGPGAVVPSGAASATFVLENTPTCESCISALRGALAPVAGVFALEAQPDDPRIVVRYDAKQVDPAKLLAALAAAHEPARLER